MYRIKTKHLLMTIAAIIFSSCVSIHAQDSTVQPESRHILILNKTYETIKEANIGDELRIKLIDATKVKGHITSIDSTSFTIDNNVVHLNEIVKILTKKRSTQFVLGGALIAGGIVTFGIGAGVAESLDAKGGFFFLGLGLTSAGAILMLPGYKKIGKSRFILISNKPND